MKKCFLIVLTAVVVMSLCSCNLLYDLPLDDFFDMETVAVETVNPYCEIVPEELNYSEGYTPVESSYSYDALPLEGEKILYAELLDACYDISPKLDKTAFLYFMPQIEIEGYSLTEAQVRTTIKALTDDRPEIFWIAGTLWFYSDDTSTLVQLYSNYSPEEVDDRVNAVRAVASEFYATVPDGLSEYERELMVHDYLIDRVTYDKDVDLENSDKNDPDIYTPYGALVNQVAVCEGYARSFQMLMNGLGVDCVGVMGNSFDELHIWNAVKLNDKWYNVDATWDDQEEVYMHHMYFNVDDNLLLDDHTLAPMYSELSDDEINGLEGDYSSDVMNLFVPKCTSSDMGYYYRETPHLKDFDGEEVKSGLLETAMKEEEYFVFYIDEDLDYATAISELFADYPQYFFGYMNAVNNSLSDYSIDSSNVSYYMFEKNRMVVVEMHYY